MSTRACPGVMLTSNLWSELTIKKYFLNGLTRRLPKARDHRRKVQDSWIRPWTTSMFCLNQSSGIIKWSKNISRPVLASPATIRDKVFFAASDQAIYCFNVKDGSKIWDYRTGDKIWSSASVSEYDNIMFFGSLDSHIYGIDANTSHRK